MAFCVIPHFATPLVLPSPKNLGNGEFFFETEFSLVQSENGGAARSDRSHDRRCCRSDVPQDCLIASICGQLRRREVEPDDSSPCPLSCCKSRSSKAVGRRRRFQARQREDEPNDCTTAGRRARRHDPHALAAALYQNMVGRSSSFEGSSSVAPLEPSRAAASTDASDIGPFQGFAFSAFDAVHDSVCTHSQLAQIRCLA